MTFEPDEPDLRARLHTTTPVGEAWRCLRCATYVVGPPHSRGPADTAPEVPRGKLLRDLRIMRLLAVERLLRGLGLVGLAALVLWFRNSQDSLHDSFTADLPLLRPLADQIGWDINHSTLVRGADEVFSLSPTTLLWIALGLFAYAAIQFVEAVGLWLAKRWGEYFAVVATSVFLPLEIYELTEHVTVLRVVVFLINVAAVVWLVWSKRLFGVRGGGAAFHEEHAQASLLSVEVAADAVPDTESATS